MKQSTTKVLFQDLNESLTDSLNEDNPNIEFDLNQDGDEFEEFLQICSQSSSISTGSNNTLNSSTPIQLLKKKLVDFDAVERLQYKEDIFKFWMEHKNEIPEIFELAEIIMAVPATQVGLA